MRLARSELLTELYACRTSADDSDLLPLEVNTFGWPEARMDPSALEILDTSILRDVSLGSEPSVRQEEGCSISHPVFGLHNPFRTLFVPYSRVDVILEDIKVANIPRIGNTLEVCTQLCRTWEALFPISILPEL